jgi:hypothetical protein
MLQLRAGFSGMVPSSQDRTRADDAAALIEDRLTALVRSPPVTRTVPPARVLDWLDDLLGRADTYRDATLAILAFPVAAGELLDIRLSPPSRRGVTQRLTRVCESLSIPCKKDAFQTLGKGNVRLDGLDRPSWRDLLTWASTEATLDEVRASFAYFAEGMASLARPLPPMPELITRRLTFPALAAFFDRMLSRPSRGAHEQFILGALLAAAAEADGGFRVETKPLNASDASAGTAADIQVWRRGVLEEAFEVSANRWQAKIVQAAQTRERADLPRIHLVAAADSVSGVDVVHALADEGLEADVDVSVLDIRHEIRSLTARLTRPSRKVALRVLYVYLKNRQPDDSLVVDYVNAIHEAKLAEDSS